MPESPGPASPERGTAPRRALTAWRWTAVPATLLLVTLLALLWPRSAPVATPPPTPSEQVQAPTAVLEVPPAIQETPSATPEPAAPSTPAAAPTTSVIVTPSTAVPPRPTPRPAPQVTRVRIPALGVDAPILQMGFDSAGVMEVPQSPSTVAWYGFSAMPGNPGNAVMAAHVTWGGARAVFNQLSALHAGDVIEVRTSDGDIRYVVQRSYLVRPEEADVPAIVGPRDGPQTLTLITCGGSFDSSVREYDHRVIVFATRA